jgi:DNA topoisomerase-1
VFKKGTALVPSFTAFAVVNLLEEHFRQLVDYQFTAQMEDDLDSIAGGQVNRIDWLTRFYFGVPSDGDPAGLAQLVRDRLSAIDAREVNSIVLGQGSDGADIVVRIGRYGPYVQRDGDAAARASLPDDVLPDELTVERAEELLATPAEGRELGTDPETGDPIVVKKGRFGDYVTTVPPEGSAAKPRTASLLRSMNRDTLTLDDALRLLRLPRIVGIDPETNEEIVAQNGRYGPYLTRGKESRSLESEEQLFTVGLDEARALFAQPKRGRGRTAAAAPPLRELGADPATGSPVVVKEGRFGPYVTDGTTNASLRRGDTVDEITLERAAELLADRRSRDPVKPARKTAAKKPPAKSAPAKTAATKSSASRTPGTRTARTKAAPPADGVQS